MASASARWPRPTTTPPTAAGAPTRRWPARSRETLSGWCRPACATARGGQPRRRGRLRPAPQPATPRTTASAAPAQAAAAVDGGHRFGVTGEFKRTADFDNMFEQGAGTSYLYGENSVRKETERQRVSLDYSYRRRPTAACSIPSRPRSIGSACRWIPPDGGARRGSAGLHHSRDPFRYGFPSGPWRDNSIRQTMYGVNAEATKRLGGAVCNCGPWAASGMATRPSSNPAAMTTARDPSRHTRAVRPARLRHAAHQPGRRAAVRAVGHVCRTIRLRRRPLHADAGAALRPLQAKPESTDSYASNPNAGKLPSANSAGRFSPKLLAGWKAADELSLYAQYAYGFKAPSRPSSTPTTAAPAPICAWAIPI